MSELHIFACIACALILILLYFSDQRTANKESSFSLSPKSTLFIVVIFFLGVVAFKFREVIVTEQGGPIVSLNQPDGQGILTTSAQFIKIPSQDSDQSKTTMLTSPKQNTSSEDKERSFIDRSDISALQQEVNEKFQEEPSTPTKPVASANNVTSDLPISSNIIYSNQIASFTTLVNAKEFIRKHQDQFTDAKFFIGRINKDGQTYFKVLFDLFADDESARQQLPALKQKFSGSFTLDLSEVNIDPV